MKKYEESMARFNQVDGHHYGGVLWQEESSYFLLEGRIDRRISQTVIIQYWPENRGYHIYETPKQSVEDLMERVSTIAIGHPKGFTFDPLTGNFPDKGWAVGIDIGLPEDHPKRLAVVCALAMYSGYTIGGWFDKGNNRFVYDCVELIETLNDAIVVAGMNDQKAIFNLESKEEYFLSYAKYEYMVTSGGINSMTNHKGSVVAASWAHAEQLIAKRIMEFIEKTNLALFAAGLTDRRSEFEIDEEKVFVHYVSDSPVDGDAMTA